VQKPLAIVVVGGIGLVPFFILVVFPAMIDLLGRPRDLAQSEKFIQMRRARAGLAE